MLPNTRIEKVSLEEFGYPALEILILPDEVDNIKYLPEHDGLTVYAPADVCSYYASKYPKINFVVKGSEAEMEQIINDYINSLIIKSDRDGSLWTRPCLYINLIPP